MLAKNRFTVVTVKVGEISLERSEYTTGEWALEELAEVEELGLIPDVLVDADLSQDITRAEFDAVTVKVCV